MPEKIANTTQSIENNNALRQALVVIEHKIRNLEKRKTKLESYRAIQNSGKELSSDQKAAVAKYDEVAQSLEFARDLSKQMLQIANASEKEEKKKARKDAILRAQAETAKIREVLTIQNILVAFTDENIRNDFQNGSNGAVKLEQNDFTILEKFCLDIQVKRQESPNDQSFSIAAQKAAEHFSLTIDGRPKQYGETTYENVKLIFQKIQDCGYLDRAGSGDAAFEEEILENQTEVESVPNNNEENEDELQKERISETEMNITSEITQSVVNSEDSQQLKGQVSQTSTVTIIGGDQNQCNVPKFTSEAPSAAAVPAPAFPPTPQTATSIPAVVASNAIPNQLQQPQIALQQLQRQQGPHQINLQQPTQTVQQIAIPTGGTQIQGVPAPGHFPPTTVRAVEQAYFKQHQYIQQMRPLAEVIGGGNFFFLQDSELDSPDVVGLPGPHGFPNAQQLQPQQQNINDVQQQSISNVSNSNPPGQQLPPVLNAVQQPTGISQSVNGVQPNPQQQVQPNKQAVNPLANATNLSAQTGPNIVEQPATIPTQTFTNQSFPPIVPPSQVQPMFPQATSTSVTHSPGIQQQQPVVNINVSNNNEKSQQAPPVVSIAPMQQPQSNQTQTTQIPQIFTQNASAMPSITPHQLIAHHQQQQQQSLNTQTQPSVAGTTTNLSLAEQQVAALASIQQQQQQQQQHNQHQQMQQQQTNPNNLSGLPTGFANTKFPSNIVPTPQSVSVQPQQSQTQIPPHHNLNNQVNNLNSIGNSGNNLTQQSPQDKYDQAVRILEHKTQKLDIKERTGQVQVKDIISTASVNDWETDATKLQMQQQQTSQQVHKPPSHFNASHSTSHFHTAQQHNTSGNNNNVNDRGGPNINESNQWSNDMHTNSQHVNPNAANNVVSGALNKGNEWVSTFDSQESNHWNNSSEASGNYRGRQSFGRNDRANGGGPGSVRNSNDRSDNVRSSNTGGYRGRSNYSASQNGNGQNSNGPGSGGMGNNGNRNSNVYFRNNDNYYQNGNNGGYNGSNKDNGNPRYGNGGGGGGNGNSGENYRGRPTPSGVGNSGGGPRTGGNGPPPRQQRNSLASGGNGVGPRGQTSGPRNSTGGYGNRPPRQQDINVVN